MDLLKLISGILPGNKTVLAAVGLVIAAVWAWQQKDYTTALTLVSQALAAVGIRVAVQPVDKPAAPVVLPQPVDQQPKQ